MTQPSPWLDPETTLWGFHVHQEVPTHDEFSRASRVQLACSQYLTAQCAAPIDHADCIRPGYGPHLGYMWELRVESARFRAIPLLGRAIAWMCINHRFLGGYIHGTMHDETAPLLAQLRQEGETNQRHAIFFGHERVPQFQDFFFSPPGHADSVSGEFRLLDTRASRVMTETEISEFRARGSGHPHDAKHRFLDPAAAIVRGFHIHVDYDPSITADRDLAMAMFDALLVYLVHRGHRPSSTRLYEATENGPHLWAGFEIKFEYRDYDKSVAALGLAMAWLMCNRSHLSVFSHAVTWEEGDLETEMAAHVDHSFFIGQEPPLRLEFFQDLIEAGKTPSVAPAFA